MAGIKITETALRDGHQSLIATRMTTKDMLPIADKLDRVGFHALEVWGGATFDSCLRYLNEDPWERLRSLRKVFKNTKLQMLLRGQNLLGYKNYSDDVVDEFVKKSIENGIDIIRIFDALNDIRNIKTAVESTKKYGGHAQGAISYTTSPVHNIEYYINLAVEMEKMGVDSICIKDMSGILIPYVAEELVKELKKNITVPIEMHGHFTSGLANQTYMKAIEAGADIIDTAISPFGNGTSQPATEPMIASLKGSPYYPEDIDFDLLLEVAEYFKELRDKYEKEGLLNTKVLNVDVNTLKYQVPGGMLSNLVSQLKSQNAEDKFDEVLKEIPRVREDFGYPPLVTPMSQMVGTQAVFNVILGERYKMIPTEAKNYVKGLYGKTPAPISDKIKRIIIGEEEQITGRPADLLEPELDKYREEIKEYIEQEEDVLSYALFPQVALEFFKKRQGEKYNIEDEPLDERGIRKYIINVAGNSYEVEVEEVTGLDTSQIKRSAKSAPKVEAKEETKAEPKIVKQEITHSEDKEVIKAPMPGNIWEVLVSEGEVVKAGDVLFVLEAMKMENEIVSPIDGKVISILTSAGSIVNTDDKLAILE